MKAVLQKFRKIFSLTIFALVFFGVFGGIAMAMEAKPALEVGLELRSEKLDFAINEIPEFDFKIYKERSMVSSVGAFIKNIFTEEYKDIDIRTEIDGMPDNILKKSIKYSGDGSFTLDLNKLAGQIKPGSHEIDLTVTASSLNGGEPIYFSQEFTWGVLAYNSNKSVYKIGDEAYLQLAVLDENGDTLCGALLDIEIDTPGFGTDRLSTANGTITINPACGPNNVIDEPDYYAYYPLDETGDYEVSITAHTANGEYTISDIFRVERDPAIMVEREAPTRIWPKANYQMKINLRSVDGFQGDIIEKVPGQFSIFNFEFSDNIDYPISNIKVEEEGGIKKIVIPDFEVKAGEDYSFSYEFDAPNVSPEFYLLGELEYVIDNRHSVLDNRQWQIASDAVGAGVAWLAATGTTFGADLNTGGFAPLSWGEQDFDSVKYSFSSSIPSRLTVKEGGDFLLALTMPLYRSDPAGNNRTRTQAEIRVNGSKVDVGVARSSYIRNANDGTDESSNHFAVMIEDLNPNDYIEIYTIGVTSYLVPVYIRDQASLYVEEIPDAESVFTGTAVETTDSVDLSGSIAYELVWTEGRNDSGFSHEDGSSPEEIILDEAGDYLVFVNIPLYTTTARANVTGRILLDGTPVSGGTFQQGYIRISDNDNYSSIHWSGVVRSTAVDQVLSVSTIEDGAAGTVTVSGEKATIYVQKLPSTGIYYARGTNLDVGTNWNDATPRNILWENDDIIDTDTFTHNTGSNPHQVTVDKAGDYLVAYNDAMTSSAGRPNNLIEVRVNGTAVSGAQTATHYIRNSGQESSASLVFLLNDLSVNDMITVTTGQAADDDVVDDMDDAVLFIRYIDDRIPPVASINSITQKTDGSGAVDISIEVVDGNNDEAVAKVEYVANADCDFTSPLDPTIDFTDINVSADYGDPDVDDQYEYQIGTTSARILTDQGSNTVNFDWLSKQEVNNATGTYCVRVTLEDSAGTVQTVGATSTVYIDNLAPQVTDISTADDMYIIGDTLTATITVVADAGEYTLAASSINGVSVIGLQKINDTTYTIDYTVSDGDTDRTAGTIPYSFMLTDAYGNTSNAHNGTFTNGSIDANSPAIISVTAPDLMLGIGDTMTATITVASDVDDFTLGNSTINGQTVSNLQKKGSSGLTWFNSSWLYRKKITINSSQVVASQTGFVVLATTTDANLATYARSDGHDILFTDSDGTTQIPYEREYWQSGTGELVAWVKVDISSTVDKDIYIYYGNSGMATDQSATTGVWDSGYRGIWHMSDDPSGLVYDSSSNGNNMTADASMNASDLVNGYIGQAIHFDGAADELVNTSPSGYTAPSDYTMSAWFYYASDPTGWENFYSHTTTGGNYDPQWAMNNNTIDIYDGATINFGTYAGGGGSWHKIDYIRTGDTGSNVVAYIDGVQFGTAQAHNADILVPSTIYIGASSLNGELWTGQLDEVRYSEVARSTAWIQTEYNNQLNTEGFLSYDTQEELVELDYYTVDYTVVEGNTDRATGTIPYSIILNDNNGNSSSAFTGNFADASIDAHRPIVQSVFIYNGTYGIGDDIILIIDADANFDSSSYLESAITVNGKAVTGFSSNLDTTYNITYTIAEGDTDRPANTVPVSVVLSDIYGNTNTVPFTSPSPNSATIDANRPKILSISLPDQAYKIGDTVQATAIVQSDANSYTLGATTINNVTADNLQKLSDTIYTFDYVVALGNSDRTAGTIPVSLILRDQINQENSPASTTVEANTASIDANPPSISSISFVPSSGVMKVGDIATATISLAGSELGATAGALVKINNVDVKSTFTDIGSGNYRMVYTVSEGDDDHPDNDDLPVYINIVDAAGNEASAYAVADPFNRPGVDGHTPVISNVTFNISSGVLKVGDTATATIFSDGTGYTAGTITINGVDVSGTLAPATGNNYTVSYTVVEGDTDVLDANDLPIYISLQDAVFNQSIAYTTADAANRPGVDGHTPTISNVVFTSTSGVMNVGSSTTITITAGGAETGLSAGNTMTVNGVDVSGTFAEIGGGIYTVTYTVIEGHTDILDSNDLPVDLSVQDDANNESIAYTTADVGNRPGVDGNTPTITNVSFLPSSGLLKVGDTATATITVGSSETGLLAGNTMTINTVDVRGTFTDIGGGNYTVTYTVQEGDIDRNDIADLPVSFSLQDSAENESLDYTTPDAANRPGVDGHTPTISAVVFEPTSGVLKVGDIATATITVGGAESSLLAGNTMTINGVDVSGTFSDIGGGEYTISYTVQEGNSDILDANDLPVNITVQDSANNESSVFATPDATNRPGVDGNTPTISNVTFDITSGLLKIGDSANITIFSDETGYLAGTITVNGVDVSGTLTPATGNNYTVTYTVAEGHTDLSDASDLPVNISLIDPAGNESTAYTTADAGNRPGVDGHAPTAPGNLSFVVHNNTEITIQYGATTTESNFAEYKIFYKIGSSGVTESDSEWNSIDDGNLGDIDFNDVANTTITGLIGERDYVFNIWAYDTAGNKASAVVDLQASTNYIPLEPDALEQRLNDNFTVVPNDSWAIDQTMVLSASSTDPEGEFYDYYYEVLPVAGSLTTATTVPATACNSGDSFNACTGKIWKYSTGPAWYDTNWLYRKQIVIDADYVVADETDFPLLSSSIDADLQRNARSDGHDIIFTAADGVTPLNFERKLWDDGTGQLITWIKTDLSSSTDNFIYMYYGNSTHSADLSTTTGVWDSSYVGVWHMDEPPTGSTDDIKDSSGNDHHMTSYNMDSSKRVVTDTGYAYEFDGSGDYLEDTDGENYINGLSNFTVELWLKSDVTNSDRGFIIGEAPAGNDSFFTLRYDAAGANNGNAYTSLVKGAITITGPIEKQYESSEGVQTTNWQHLVFRWTSGGQYEVFVNGVYDTYTFNSPAGTGTTQGADRLRIGQGGKDIGTTLGWDGLIDEVRISNVYRTDAFVQTAYNNQSNLNSFALFGAQDAVRIYNLPESSEGYIWQVMVCDEHDVCSEWVKYNTTTPNFKVDNTAPTAPGDLSEISHTSTSVKLNFGATTTESFFDRYEIHYKEYDGTPVSLTDSVWGTGNDANLDDILFNDEASTTVLYLTAGIQYEFNIWAIDESGQSASATPVTVTTSAASNAPNSSFNSAAQKIDGSGTIDISMQVNDLDNNPARVKMEYVEGADCDFTTPLDPTLDTNGANISALHEPEPYINNASEYQIGYDTNWILTSPSANTVNFDWLSMSDIPNASSTYCLRLTANDGTYTQTVLATTTVYIDNFEPSAPGNLGQADKDTYSITLQYGSATLEDNFSEYKIFYKEGSSGVTEGDTEYNSGDDTSLGDQNFLGNSTTTISGLSAGTQYVFNIWAYDIYGNKTSASEVSFTTNYIPATPTSPTQLKDDAVTIIPNYAWTNENTFRLRASALDSDASEVLTLYFEVASTSDVFTDDTSSACSASASWSMCPSQVWSVTSVPGNYSVTPYTGTVNPTGVPDNYAGLKWQVQACDDSGVCSAWTDAGADPNLKIDHSGPSTPGDLSENGFTSESVTIAFGNASLEPNFREYIIYYKEGISGVLETDTKFSSSSDINLDNRLFNSATETTISGLNPGTQYVFNIWAYDEAGNKSSASSELTVTTNNKPTGTFVSALSRTNGTGRVDVSILVDDPDDDNTSARIDYVAGVDCNFTSPLDPFLDTTDTNATSTYGDAKLDNNQLYQVGSSTGWIITSSGANTVNFDWLSKTNLPTNEGTYCLRLTVNDGIEDQATVATTTVYIDNKNPTAPGDLTLSSKTGTSFILNYGATTTEPNFTRYRIYYKQGAASINEDGSQIIDNNLLDILFNNVPTTTVSGLLVNTQYSFKIYAYDSYGNKSSSNQVSFTTNARPTGVFNSVAQKINGTGIVDISIEIYDVNTDPVTAKLEFATGTTCNFASPGDPTLDESPTKITADHGKPGIENDNEYQVGTSTALIITSGGSNTVNFDWLSANDIPNASGVYCLRLTANDGYDDQTIRATTTLVIDNTDPAVPGNLTEDTVGGISITLGLGATTTDDYFSEYKIFYKAYTPGVTELDTVFNQYDDPNLADIEFNDATTVTINNLAQSTLYYFNIWAFDLYGNRSNAAAEVSTSTIIVPSATWREELDIVDPTVGTYLGKEQAIRLRLAVANSGDWVASDYHYRLEYGAIEGDCASVSSWQTVPVSANTEHFELLDSVYLDHFASTTRKFVTIPESFGFTPGYVIENLSTSTGGQTIYGGDYTELEYVIQPTANSVAGETYCFRATDDGTVFDSYSQYPEFTLAPPALATFNLAKQRSDGLGIVDLSIDVSDGDGDLCQVKIEYVNNTVCDFSAPLLPQLDTTDENISATYGDPDIDNAYTYQIGTSSGMIITQYGVNTVEFDWSTIAGFDNTDSDYCVRITAYDGFEEQTTPATTTLTIDNLDPVMPGDVQFVSKTSNSVTLSLDSFSSDRNFAEYKIFYKEGTSGVTEGDSMFGSSSDINLADESWDGATTTTVTGLEINKQYVFKIWAYDQFGNKAATANEVVATLRYVAMSENWRWYYDQFNETPESPAAAEETTPNNITDGSSLKLRMALREVESITGGNIKMRLQYSTYSDFSADVFDVGEIGSSTAIWTYGDGIDEDDDVMGYTVLSGSEYPGRHNESGISASTFSHVNDSVAEWEFTIRNNDAPVAVTYYFRAYDNVNDDPVEINDGFSYPSLITEAGSLTFSTTGFSSGGSTEGVTANIDTTPTSVPLGDLSLSSEAVGVHRFEIDTNAGSGYQLFAYQRQTLLSNNGADIDPVSGTNATPVSWPIDPSPSAFGYHTGDDTLSGGNSSRFAPDNTYARFETTPTEVSFSPIPTQNEIVDLVFRVEVSNMQEAGEYETEIVYILVPTFY